MEGVEFTGEQLAGQWAFNVALDSGYVINEQGLEIHLDVLAQVGASFDPQTAVAHAMRLKKAGVIDRYEVTADRETGQWLGEPQFMASVRRSDWVAKQDTAQAHFVMCELSDETQAIEVVFAE